MPHRWSLSGHSRLDTAYLREIFGLAGVNNGGVDAFFPDGAALAARNPGLRLSITSSMMLVDDDIVLTDELS
jgi:hypothetical protein